MTGVADTIARQGNTAHTVFPADDSFSGAVVAAIRQCLQVRGRLAKAPYQKVLAVVVLLWIVGFPLLNMMLGDSDSAGTCLMTLSFPLVTATIRRLHDTGRSARWMWLAFTGLGVPLLLVLACQPSQAGPNRFGPFGQG